MCWVMELKLLSAATKVISCDMRIHAHSLILEKIMIKRMAVNKAIWVLMDLLLVFFVLPFGFVLLHFFPLLLSGGNRTELLEDLISLSVTVSWVSCSFLFLIAFVIRTMIKRGARWYALFALSFVGGGVWLLLWNIFILPTFSFGRSLFPLTLGCVVSTAYALGKALYKDDSLNFADHPQFDYREGEDADIGDEVSDSSVPPPGFEDHAVSDLPSTQSEPEVDDHD